MAIDRIVVRSGPPLEGTVTVAGAKNSALKLMAATLLAEGSYRLSNVPRIVDVDLMAELLRAVGCTVEWDPMRGSRDPHRCACGDKPGRPLRDRGAVPGLGRGPRAHAGPLRRGHGGVARRR